MCDTCGCEATGNKITYSVPGEENKHQHSHVHEHNHGNTTHSHEHVHTHEHANEGYHHHEHLHEVNHSHSQYNQEDHGHHHEHKIAVEVDIMSKNNLLAERNRGYFEAKNVKVLNLMSSPGSGKTTLLEKTIQQLNGKLEVAVIEGDQQTQNDAERIQKTGTQVIQVNTGNGCHLDADMVNKASKKLALKEGSVLFIENVGNLVCPSLFDLGEQKRVVIISTTEGEDKPIKYPTMFEHAHLCIINKTDLLPYLDFDMEACKKYALQVNHHLEFIEVSAKTGEGMDAWLQWINNL
ncbi:MAG: hydrogenase accessory protein HypB [Bacteroidetes bacterium HGW-Bacteroidetes-4]|jgi:hydrogenase nickel incorporation protein HypB|nr:MAG: hydrogenase accessory protein HypB [Bacteroidetes bacterium HGW-Bacteroidetes-4]